MVLLVLRDQIVHVRLGLAELHLVHALAGVPMKESFPPEHGGEVLGDSLEQLLYGRRVADEGGGHLQTARRNVADGGFHVVRDPLDKVGAVLVLNVQHLLVDLFHRHPAAEHHGHRQVSSVSRIARRHHVLRVEHLLSELGHRQRSVLLASSGGERREARHEKVQTWERDHVDRQLSQIGVQLPGESEAGGHPGHRRRHQMIQIPVRRRG